ncbi:MAG: RluA family pseudouridine synthase [Rickettsiales bacterium]|jgi:23S rRNA pseudouridine1911/1915/1917 synthase|nr:RluA family pseudouridine synthase [Rickettsiales bacterium]
MNKKNFAITEPFPRLDAAAQSLMPELSRSKIQKMEMTLNGKPAKWSAPARPGDTLEIIINSLPAGESKPLRGFGGGSKLNILYEDPHIIAAVKPRGIATHPGAGRETETFVQMLLSHTALAGGGDNLRPGIVHRLDKDTSGILVAAKTDTAFAKLSEMFSRHDLKREYTAFVWGVPSWESAEISGNIRRSKKNRQKMALVKIGGKPATTLAETRAVWPRAGVAEIKARLLTGRTHQIRVHLSTHGFPLVGDNTYGSGARHKIQSVHPGPLLDFMENWTGGQMLHAGTLEFAHPITGKPIKLHSPLPGEMQLLKDLLNEYF